MKPDWKEAAEKYLKQRFPEYQKDDSVMHVDVEVFQAGAEHACEQLKQELAERDAEIAKLQEAVKWYKAAHELFAKHGGEGKK